MNHSWQGSAGLALAAAVAWWPEWKGRSRNDDEDNGVYARRDRHVT